MDSEYSSVSEQAGIYIGDGGITADIRGKTILEGGIIESRATKDKNIFNTGTIEWKDIANKSRYSSKEKGIAVQKTFGNTEGMNQEDKAWEGITPNMGQNIKGKDSSTTQSAVSDSITLNITDKDRQKQDINELRRNTENTTNTLEANPTKEETDEKRELASITQQFLHDVVGDLKESGAISKDLGAFLNVAVSGIATGFAGGDIKSGLVGGITTEALQKALEKVDPDLRKLVAGIVAGTVAEGIGLDGSTAGNTGVAVEQFNHTGHPEQREMAERRAEEDPDYSTLSPEAKEKRIDFYEDAQDTSNSNAFVRDVEAGKETAIIFYNDTKGNVIAVYNDPRTKASVEPVIGVTISAAEMASVGVINAIPGAGQVLTALGGGFLFVDGMNGVFSNMTELTNVWQGTNYQTANIVKEAVKAVTDPVTGGHGELVYDGIKVSVGVAGIGKGVIEFIQKDKTLANIATFAGQTGINGIGLKNDLKELSNDINKVVENSKKNKEKKANKGGKK